MSRPKTGSTEPNGAAPAWRRNFSQLAANSEPTTNAASAGAARASRSRCFGTSSWTAAWFWKETVTTRPRVARTIARWLTKATRKPSRPPASDQKACALKLVTKTCGSSTLSNQSQST